MDEAKNLEMLKQLIADHKKKMEKYDPRYWAWCEPDFIAVEGRLEQLAREWGNTLSMISIRSRQRLPLSLWQKKRDKGQ